MPKLRDLSQIGKFSLAKKKEFLRLILEDKLPKMQAAREIGIGYATVLHHLKTDEDFAAEMAFVEAFVNDEVQEALLTAARNGDINAIKFWLMNRDPVNWSDKKTTRIVGDLREEKTLTLKADISVRPEQLTGPATHRAITNLLQGLGSDGSGWSGDGSIEGEVVASLPSPRDQRGADEGGNNP